MTTLLSVLNYKQLVITVLKLIAVESYHYNSINITYILSLDLFGRVEISHEILSFTEVA